MQDDAIINGQTVILSDKERVAGETFHRSRLAFAWIDGQLTLNRNHDDDRDHQHWLMEDYGFTLEQWEATPRGYIKEGRVQFFIGSDFRPIDMEPVTSDEIIQLCLEHRSLFPHTEECSFYNGVHVGKIGELWPPIHFVATYTII